VVHRHPKELPRRADRFPVERFLDPTGPVDCGVPGRIRENCEDGLSRGVDVVVAVRISFVIPVSSIQKPLRMRDGPRETEGGEQALVAKPRDRGHASTRYRDHEDPTRSMDVGVWSGR